MSKSRTKGKHVPSERRQIVGLIAWVGLCFGAAGLGGWATASSVDTWYAELQKPAFNPPDWVFSPVWSVLYLSMAVAAWLVWRREGLRPAALPLGLFVVQLALNAAWSVLFFGLRSPGWAMLDLALLWCAILATAISFWYRSAVAAWLLMPYLAWVSFAGALNFMIWRLNG
jgi:translocator protein